MNPRPVLGIFGYLLLIMAGCLLAPLAVALLYESKSPYEASEIFALSFTLALSLCGGAVLLRRYRKFASQLGRREGYLVVAGSWVLATLVGMLPYILSGVLPSLTDAFFETMSGFTTTGVSVFGDVGREIERIPHGILFWRCMTRWLGGCGIVVISVALLSFLGVSGYHLVRSEAPGGVVFERETPRMVEMARKMCWIYLGISLLEVAALLLCGVSLFDSLCHTFTTIATGGFSTHGNSAGFFDPAAQWVLIIFMFLSGVNFSLYGQVFRRRAAILKNPELRLYSYIIACAISIGLLTAPWPGSLEIHLRQVVFQVVSLGTSTGYFNTDYDQWHWLMRLVLVLLMFTGGCMGSTSGAMKPARFLVYAKVLVRELHRLVFPHGVRPIRIGEKVLETRVVSNFLAFGFGYAMLFLVGAATMTACGYDFSTSASASASCLGNVGGGLGMVGPAYNWAHIPMLAKWVMSTLMLLGRLEIFSVLILCTPWVWKK